jgi:hypothetical protein
MEKYIFTEQQIKNVINSLINEQSENGAINEIDLGGDKFGGNVALRKLSFKSKWDFTPKHLGYTIDDVLKHYPASVYWAYTNLEKISFVDDILTILSEKFPTFRRIDKPGVDVAQYDEYKGTKVNPWEKYTYEELKGILVAKKKNKQFIGDDFYSVYRRKRYETFRAHSGKNELDRKKMMSVNHGHNNITDVI